MSKTRKKEWREAHERALPLAVASPGSTLESLAQVNEELQERLATLELALEDEGWYRLSGESENEFSRAGLTTICNLARLYWLKNPLVRRMVAVMAFYVFGQGVQIRANDAEINAVVQEFLDDSKNKVELTAHQAMMIKERELTLFANLFFVFFRNQSSGAVRVRTIPMGEVEDVLCNPEDAKEPWFYKRTWSQRSLDGGVQNMTRLYPDWQYRPKAKAQNIVGIAVAWDTPVYHVKVNCLSDMRFGVSEVYSALDWAKAYKAFLEDWATLVRAYARFAWQLTTKGGKTGIAAAKAKLATTIGSDSSETNPPPVAGSTFISGSPDVNLQPIRTAGATTSAEDGRRILLMVAAGAGLPESFFGDVSVGTLATAKSLDRPTELMMRDRQMLWTDVFKSIFGYVVESAVRAGKIRGEIVDEEDESPRIEFAQVEDRDTGEMVDRDPTINVTFPPILEHDVQANVAAIVQAATLGGAGMLAGTIDAKTVSRLILQALGVEDVDAVMDVIYPPEGEQGTAAESQMMVEAVRELREAVAQFVERNSK